MERNKGRVSAWLMGGGAAIAAAAAAAGAYAWFNGGSKELTDNFGSCLGFKKEDRWIVLSRPNSYWAAGTAIQFSPSSNQPEPLGDFLKNCVPELKVDQVVGDSAPVACTKAVSVEVSLSSTFGGRKQPAGAMHVTAGDAKEPEVFGHVQIVAAREQRVDLLQIENYLDKAHFDAMPFGCKSTLTDASRFVIAGVYQVTEGSIDLAQSDGAKIDLSLPKFESIRDAAIQSGFKVTSGGSIAVSAETAPLTFAVRSADFGKALQNLGIQRRGEADFEQRMKASGQTLQR